MVFGIRCKKRIFDPELMRHSNKIKKKFWKIIDIVEKGYKLGDKIIRYPKVVVGQ